MRRDLERTSAELDTLRASITAKDEALREAWEDAKRAQKYALHWDAGETWRLRAEALEKALSPSAGSELLEAERAEEWRKNRELRSENDTLKAALAEWRGKAGTTGVAHEDQPESHG